MTTAAALHILESSPSAWMAITDHRCGGFVPVGGQWSRCPETGTWKLAGHGRTYCPVHAARRLHLADAHRRAHTKETTR